MLGHHSSPKVYANLGPIIYLIYSLSLLIPQCGTQHSHMHSQQIYPHVSLPNRPNSPSGESTHKSCTKCRAQSAILPIFSTKPTKCIKNKTFIQAEVEALVVVPFCWGRDTPRKFTKSLLIYMFGHHSSQKVQANGFCPNYISQRLIFFTYSSMGT